MLLEECRKAGAQLRLGVRISAVSKSEDGFVVVTDQGEFRCRALVVATGGPSIPKMGSSGFGYKIAEQFGLTIVPPRAALVPLTFDAALLAQFRRSGRRFGRGGRQLRQDAVRRGAAVHPSRPERSGDPADIVLLARGPGHRRRHGARHRRAGRAEAIAQRPSPAGNGDRAGRPSFRSGWRAALRTRSQVRNGSRISPTRGLRRLTAAVKQWRVRPSGTEGYRTAEVTLGGVDTSGLSSKTFEARSVPGLYFIGEVVDVTGHLGGFNFQWAWSSGYAAGRHV